MCRALIPCGHSRVCVLTSAHILKALFLRCVKPSPCKEVTEFVHQSEVPWLAGLQDGHEWGRNSSRDVAALLGLRFKEANLAFLPEANSPGGQREFA